MLTIARRSILIIHIVFDISVEELRSEEHSWISTTSEVGLISGVCVVTFFSSRWYPLLGSDESIAEDVVRINSKESSISVISYTTTIVTLGNENFESCPVDVFFGFEGWIHWLSILEFAHVLGQQTLANIKIRISESIDLIPTERLELLPLDQNRMEPAESVDSFSELLLFLTSLEVSDGTISLQHVGFNTLRWLLSDLDRVLQQGDREVIVWLS